MKEREKEKLIPKSSINIYTCTYTHTHTHENIAEKTVPRKWLDSFYP